MEIDLIFTTGAWEEVKVSSNRKVIKPKYLYKVINWADTQRLKSETLPFIQVQYSGSKIIYLEAHGGIVRELPIYYSINGSKVLLSDSPDNIINCIGDFEFDSLSIKEFLSFGYVTSNRTLLSKIYSIQAGERFVFDGLSIKNDSEYIYNTVTITDESREILLDKLKSIAEEVFHELILSLEGKKVIVPLSGGYDSRFIVSMLKMGGFDNVTCYFWGVEGNKEIEVSRSIAEKLGYEWIAIDYSKENWHKAIRSEWYQDCMRYVSKFTSISVSACIPFLNYLHEQPKEDFVLIPGHTGDFIGGGHIPDSLNKSSSLKDVVGSIFNKHFLGDSILSEYGTDLFAEIFRQVEEYSSLTTDSYRALEAWEWRERQSKLIANANRYYEFFGYSWYMPFWDSRIVDFWSAVPLEQKQNLKLYDEFLESTIFNKLDLQFDCDLMRKSKVGTRKNGDLLPGKGHLSRIKKHNIVRYIFPQSKCKTKKANPFGFDFILPILYGYAGRDFPKGSSVAERLKKQFHWKPNSNKLYSYLSQYVLSMLLQVMRESKKQMSKEREIQSLIDSGLPEQMKPCLCFLVKGTSDGEAETVTQEVEKKRAEIASEGSKQVAIRFSPKPGSSGDNTDARIRLTPGITVKRALEKIAFIDSKSWCWGTVLYLLARSFKSTTVFELGSCVGISASYLSHTLSVNKLITVEGSEDLARIAEDSLARFAGKSKVVNSLFDDAIDGELPMLDGKIDFAYIDGHHEKIATIHYFNKLLPYLSENALVIFDDISWSNDMREAWDILRKREEFSHAMDLGVIGVCILKDNTWTKTTPDNWDLQPIIGRRRIGKPWFERIE